MSKQVDERVVSMQFDNKQFESNVKTSMSTIDKLKAKLDFKGVAKGLENVDSAAKKVNMSGLGAGVEAVSAKFSALQVMGVTALANITNSAVNAGKRIVSALTIDPVKTGFQEYETQINAVQTILANTESKGSTIDDVNQALEELNKYADMTIYNFTEMTRNIGTFTAAGVDLATSTNAIKGIANLAAVSGSTSQQASTAMYQLSQALASGTVKLMDWNSVVNAGMGGQVFQDALKETARVHGVAIDEMIESEGSFRETLKDGWLTSEILTDTLQKFTLTTDGLTESQIEANREMLRAKGYTEEQIEGIFKLGRTATDAATKVKTFTQLFDVLKEAAQSGWAQTWKIIVGDFEEAKALFTPLADMLTGFINKMSDARNNFLNAVLYPWKVIEDKLNGAGLGKIKKTIESVTDLSKTLEYYQQVMQDVWMGKYKNSDTGRYGLLDAAGHDHRVVQDLVNLSDTYYKGQGYKYQLTIEDVQNSQRKFGVAVSESSETVVEMTEVLENLTDEQLKNAGLTEEEIKLYRMLADEAKRTGKPITELIKRMSEVDGRTLLINGLKNAGDVLVGTFKAIGEAWGEIFDPPSIVRAYSVLDAFHEFSKKLRLTDENTGELNDNGQKLMRTFKGIFAVVDIITTILGGGFKIAFKVVTTLLGMFNLNILDFTALVGDALVKVRDWFEGLFDIEGIAKAILPYVVNLGKAIKNAFAKAKEYIGPAVENFKEWFAAVKDSHILPFLERLGKGLKNTFGKIADIFRPAIDGVKKWIDSLKKSDNLAYDIVTGIANGLVNGVKLISKAINVLATEGWDGLKSLFSKEEGEGIGGNIIDGLAQGIKDGAKLIWDALVELANSLIEKFKEKLGIHSPSTKFIAIGGFIVAGLLIGLKAAFPEVWETIKEFGQKFVGAFKDIDWGALAALITMLGTLFVANKFADAFKNLTEPLDEFGGAVKRLSKGASHYMNAKAFQELAKALAILVACIVILTLVDQGKMWSAVGAVFVMGLILGGLMIVMSKASKINANPKEAFDIVKISLAVLAMCAGLTVLAIAMIKLSSIRLTKLAKGAGAIISLGGIVVGLIAATKLAGPEMLKTGASLLLIAGAIYLLVTITEKLATIKPEDLKKGIGGIIAFGIIITGLIAATKLAGGSFAVASIGLTILQISIAIGVLVYVAKMCAAMSVGDLFKGGVAVAAFGLIVTGLVAAIRFVGGEAQVAKIGGTILAVSFAIGVLVLVATLCSYIKTESLVKGGIVVAAFSAIVVGLVAAVRFLGGPAYAKQMGSSILMLSFAVGVLALVAVLLGFVKVKNLAKGITAVGLLASIVAAMIKATKDVKKCVGNLIVMTVAIAVMAGAIAALSFIKPEALGTATAALSSVMGMFALMIKSTKGLTGGKQWAKAMGTIGIMVGVVVALAGIIALLSMIPNPQAALQTATALSILLLALSASLLIISKINPASINPASINSAFKGILALTAMVVPLIAFTAALAFMPAFPTYLADNLKLLIPVMLLMTALIVPLTLIGTLGSWGALVGVLALLAMVAPLITFTAALAFMPAFPAHVADNLKLLLPVMTAMTALLIPLTLIGVFWIPALAGILALTAMVVPLAAFCLAFKLLPDISAATQTIDLLKGLMTTLGDILVKLAPMAGGATLAAIALTAISALVVEMGVMAGVVGALVEKFPELQTFIDTGIPILEQLAHGLGSVLGNVISGFAGEIMTILPEFGMSLSMFMMNAQGFIVGARMVDESVLKGVGVLTASILAFTAASLINGIVELLPFCGSLADLGTELSMFMSNALPFIIGANMIKPECLKGIKSLAEAILIVTAVDMLDGIKRFFTGSDQTSMAKFGSELTELGKGLNGFVTALGPLTDDQVTVAQKAADMIKILAKAANDIPNSGGWLGALIGNNDIGPWAEQLPTMASGIKGFIDALTKDGKLGKSEVEIANTAAEIITTLAKASQEIPNAGGLLASWLGDNDLSTFASQLPTIGEGIKGFINALSQGGKVTFGTEQVETAKSAAEVVGSLAKAAQEIPNTGGLLADWLGDNDLSTFSDKLPKVGEAVAGFADKVGTFGSDKLNTVKAAIEAVKVVANMSKDYSAITDSGDFGSFGKGMVKLGEKIKEFATTMNGVTKDSINAARDNIKTIISVAKEISGIDVDAVKSFADSMKKVASDGVTKFVTAFSGTDATTKASNAAKKLIDSALDGVESKSKETIGVFKDLAGEAADALGAQTLLDQFVGAGKDFGNGLIDGMEAKEDAVYAAGYALGQKAVQGEKDGQQSDSPSKLTTKAGKWLGEGLIVGMRQIGGQVYAAGSDLGVTATDTISAAVASIAEAINTDLDAEPTIRPVFDLTDLKSGAAAINGMLDGNRTLSVDTATIGSLSASMSKLQNGNNSRELLSAIRGLRKDVANNPRNSYSINGITVEEGSDVAEAIGTLVRAIKVEGRT